MQPPEGPPVWTALNFFFLGTPPPMSNTISRSETPMGTSTNPVFLILPQRLNTLVPLLCSVPMPAYQAPPFMMMGGTLA
jgi:hypothetical protein